MNSQPYKIYIQGNRSISKSSAMLLPTKVNENHKVESTNGVMVDGKDGDVSYVPYPTGSASRWTAQPVLQWIESLANAAMDASSDPSLHNGSADSGGEVADVDMLHDLSKPTPAAVISSTTDLLDQKRSSTPPLDDEYVNKSCHQWDLSFIDHTDPAARKYTRRMKNLAGSFEEMMMTAKTPKAYHDMSLAYQMVQSRLNFTFDRIIWQGQNHTLGTQQSMPPLEIASNSNVVIGGGFASETRRLLDALYEEVCQKLQNIIRAYDKASRGQGQSQGHAAPLLTPGQELKPPSFSKPMNKHQSKQELGKYMTSWLRANFTNPYPDDEGLVQIANHCGTTNQVISNWLINARTRKWRPAIIKASELGRSADLLLEDSINIFDGKPIRSVVKTQSATTAVVETTTTATSRPSTVTPSRPDAMSSANSFDKLYPTTTAHGCHLESPPATKRQRLHVVTTANFSSSTPRDGGQFYSHHPFCPPAAPKSYLPPVARNDFQMNRMNMDSVSLRQKSPRLVFDDEDEDGILMVSIQNAIDIEAMNDGSIKFDTNFFATTATSDYDDVAVDALSPTFFNINLQQTLSRYKF